MRFGVAPQLVPTRLDAPVDATDGTALAWLSNDAVQWPLEVLVHLDAVSDLPASSSFLKLALFSKPGGVHFLRGVKRACRRDR